MDFSEPHRSSRIETTDRLGRPAIAGSAQLCGASARYYLTIAIGRWLLEQRSPASPTLWKQNQFLGEERFTKPATASSASTVWASYPCVRQSCPQTTAGPWGVPTGRTLSRLSSRRSLQTPGDDCAPWAPSPLTSRRPAT